MARQVDAMVVVGGKDSANTLRLASIARECGAPTQHVESEREIDWRAIADCGTVGVTAGASTPHWQIMRVVDYLQYQAQTREHTARSLAARLFSAAAYLNVLLAVGAAAFYYASCVLQGIAYRPAGSALVFLYFLSMYLWNSLASLEMTQHLSLARYRFYRANRRWLFVLSAACIAALLALSYSQGRLLFHLMIVATVAGSAYHVTIVPRFLRPFVRYGNLRDIPTSRDLFVALAWGILLTLVPHALQQRLVIDAETVLTFVWVSSLAFLRAVIFDLRDIEGDRIMGRETLVSIVGEPRARTAIGIALRLLALVVVIHSVIDCLGNGRITESSIVFVLQLPVLLYIHLIERRNRTRGLRSTPAYTAFVDGQFVVAGVLAAVARSIVSAL